MAAEDAVNPIKGPSGPSVYAKRLDRMPANAYGEQKETASFVDKNTPLATTPDVSPTPASNVKKAALTNTTKSVGLYDESNWKDTPVQDGIDIGDGRNSSALMMKSLYSNNKVSDALAAMLPYDTTGEIGILYQQALAKGM